MDTYYNPEDLAKFGTIGEKAPELAEKFFSYYNAVFEEGALTAREKSLIALAVAHTVQCPYCIDHLKILYIQILRNDTRMKIHGKYEQCHNNLTAYQILLGKRICCQHCHN